MQRVFRFRFAPVSDESEFRVNGTFCDWLLNSRYPTLVPRWRKVQAWYTAILRNSVITVVVAQVGDEFVDLL